MASKVLIPLCDGDVAPRFDLATEALVARLSDGTVLEERTVVLPHASADELCRLVLTEGVSTVVCGGIEEEYFQYLGWKKTRVIDAVIGNARRALAQLADGRLQPGQVLPETR